MSKLPLVDSPTALEELRASIATLRDPERTIVSVCAGPGCIAFKGLEVAQTFETELAARGLSEKVGVSRTGCHGFCERGPSVVVLPRQTCYQKVTPDDVAEIVETTLVNGGLVERLLYQGEDGPIELESDIPFYKNQQRVIFGGNKMIDPLSFADYLLQGGYKALSKALTTMEPSQVIDEVSDSGLRGRGGAGFSTGRKWKATAGGPGDVRYVIVNADEGDPGAFMDRGILEGNPHSVIEGLMIAGYAIGSTEGYIYVRQEYPLAIEHVLHSISELREMGLLGENILGTGFSFDIQVHKGAGAFVSGESSALMSAIEGRVGEPRPKYIRTSVSGLKGKPSCLNNVETMANVPLIIERGADWYKAIGTEGSKGTKIFSLVGKVKNTGLVEVPMGTTIRQIVFDIGGGIYEGAQFKAVQTGGPSGGVIPEDQLDLPVDFDKLSEAGSMMGSGGLIVMDNNTCMVDVARYFIEFLSDESCGKCVPCREGIRQLLAILKRITAGEGTEADLGIIEDISPMMKDCALCGLGQSAPNPVLSSLTHFRDEYLAHIHDEHCPAGVCKALVVYTIDEEKCIGCGKCAEVCPVEAITQGAPVEGKKKAPYRIDIDSCTRCNSCYTACPTKVQAVTKISRAKARELFGIKDDETQEVTA